MDELTIEDFENVLILRNQLVAGKMLDLREYYADYHNYLYFLDSLVNLGQIDSAFLLLDPNFIESVFAILQIHRFEVQQSDKRIWNIINDLTDALNQMKAYSPNLKNQLKNQYLAYHEELRRVDFSDQQSFLRSLGYDAITLVAIKTNHVMELKEPELFIASLNYLHATIPEFFQDGEIKKRVIQKLEAIEWGCKLGEGKLRRFSRETKESFQKTKKEE